MFRVNQWLVHFQAKLSIQNNINYFGNFLILLFLFTWWFFSFVFRCCIDPFNNIGCKIE